MTSNTGGSEFPQYGDFSPCLKGMTLRDYFAAKAMQGTIAGTSGDQEAMKRAMRDGIEKFVEATAIGSYVMADAMLKARGK